MKNLETCIDRKKKIQKHDHKFFGCCVEGDVEVVVGGKFMGFFSFVAVLKEMMRR
jgi:hypothetical protein